ncbi:hypothetical protein CFC21_083527 [Triticum aestivum]|uniref:Uncharacterized protein n=3 Tax=Triticum TaxID=4564 RepID=A0A9R1B042_TRITD|nr:hypothetical protein CFC21_083527 [Triticum aestivum]VAI46553.1 unnamed protein product [Triticum turgidum subsp. durum]
MKWYLAIPRSCTWAVAHVTNPSLSGSVLERDGRSGTCRSRSGRQNIVELEMVLTIPKTLLLKEVSVSVFTGRGTWRKGSTNAIVLGLEASCPEMVLALAVIRKGDFRRQPSKGMLRSKCMDLLPARNKTWRRLRLMRPSKTVSKAKVAMVDMNEEGPGGDAGVQTSRSKAGSGAWRKTCGRWRRRRSSGDDEEEAGVAEGGDAAWSKEAEAGGAMEVPAEWGV